MKPTSAVGGSRAAFKNLDTWCSEDGSGHNVGAWFTNVVDLVPRRKGGAKEIMGRHGPVIRYSFNPGP